MAPRSHTDINSPPPTRSRQRNVKGTDSNRAVDPLPADTRRLAITAFALYVVVASLYLMLRFPDVGAMIQQYNRF